MRKIFFSFVIVLIGLTVVPGAVLAAGVQIDPAFQPDNAPTLGIENRAAGYTEKNVRTSLTQQFIGVVLGLAGIVAVYSILTNAFWMVASGGAEEKITQHKKGLMWALVGLILIILSYSIVRFIISIPFSADQAAPPPAAQAQ